jgi:hypothetical protein
MDSQGRGCDTEMALRVRAGLPLGSTRCWPSGPASTDARDSAGMEIDPRVRTFKLMS